MVERQQKGGKYEIEVGKDKSTIKKTRKEIMNGGKRTQAEKEGRKENWKI